MLLNDFRLLCTLLCLNLEYKASSVKLINHRLHIYSSLHLLLVV